MSGDRGAGWAIAVALLIIAAVFVGWSIYLAAQLHNFGQLQFGGSSEPTTSTTIAYTGNCSRATGDWVCTP